MLIIMQIYSLVLMYFITNDKKIKQRFNLVLNLCFALGLQTSGSEKIRWQSQTEKGCISEKNAFRIAFSFFVKILFTL